MTIPLSKFSHDHFLPICNLLSVCQFYECLICQIFFCQCLRYSEICISWTPWDQPKEQIYRVEYKILQQTTNIDLI